MNHRTSIPRRPRREMAPSLEYENYLTAVTALSDGTVVGVGIEQDNNIRVNFPLILEN